ncbi:hypothetical protein SADUNF_Sadunf01G0022300 [Salix dunnii]|uniref:F-box domain-containing protein n=1 Tax=Salix dunnii TaxID=1413687 RepID=A0A835N9F0_9ROSI|nr:hypothetical protein SADUNF_Sadunf01G0022300 [Salix dunnii]
MEEQGKQKKKNKKPLSPSFCPINNLDDGCLMHIFNFLSPIPDRYNTALVCHRWCYLACHPRLWLRVEQSTKDLSEPGVFPSIEKAVSAARPGDTILIAAGGRHLASNIQINKPLCLVCADDLYLVIPGDSVHNTLRIGIALIQPYLPDPLSLLERLCFMFCPWKLIVVDQLLIIGGGELPDETTLLCSRGSDSALEFISTCKLANLTVKAELGCCLLHRSGRLTIDSCILQCEASPLDYLSCPIISTAGGNEVVSSAAKTKGDKVSVSQTRIEGGAKAVLTNGDLTLQQVRVIYARTFVYFWFDVDSQ